ncbi:MAG: hypothetical protein LBN08_04475 [Lactobacillales bacterium]|jgi:peptidoglycan hydrolase CwlO-like protein|nr:hypothetical protein [Lactobacillales bacterium]
MMNKKIIAALLAAAILIAPIAASADDIDSLMQQAQANLANLTAEQAAAQAAVSQVDQEIAENQQKVEDLNVKITAKETEVGKAWEEIAHLTQNIEKRTIKIHEQARNLQRGASTANIMASVVSSSSINEGLAKLHAAVTMVGANNKIITDQKHDMDECEVKKDSVVKELDSLQAMQDDLAQSSAHLEELRIAREVNANDLAAQMATTSSQVAGYQAQKAAAEARLAQERKAREDAAAAAAAQKAREDSLRKATPNAPVPTQPVYTPPSKPTPTPNPAPNNNGPYVPPVPPVPQPLPNTGGISARKMQVINAALSEIGTSRPTGWNQPGECFCSVRRWLQAGGYYLGFAGPVSSYSAATEITIYQVQPGDVMQYAPIGADVWATGVHTVLVIGLNSNGTYQIVEANNPSGSGYVVRNNNWYPHPRAGFSTRVFRF